MKIYSLPLLRNNLFFLILNHLYGSRALVYQFFKSLFNLRSSQKQGLKFGFFILIGGLIAYFLLQKFSASSVVKDQKIVIAVSQIVEHPALNAVREGIKQTLKNAGYDPEKNLKWVYQNAHGNMNTNLQIAHKFKGMQPDVVIAISTPSAQSVAKVLENTSIPIVFTAVTDPLSANLVKNLEKPGKYVTGVTDFPPLQEQLSLIKELLPQARKLGVIYNPGESNSVSLLKLLHKEADKKKLILLEAAAANTLEVRNAVQSLVQEVDAFLIPPDNTLISVLNKIVQTGFEFQKPVFTVDSQSVYHGALASVGFSYYEVGQYTGQVVLEIIKGKNPGKISVKSPFKQEIFLNLASAKKLEVHIPAEILSKAKYIIYEGDKK